ncbi:MAG: hypothetical protein L0Y44_15970 [Phycisphaerales bacterium]|nr:hypothetical protein [Phycisphaerales bacterium]MCI0676056.1 hypothetical protein [Phycisphaerales bacterium]
MPGETKTTTDHQEIRQWVQDRGGRPVRVRNTFGSTSDTCVLQIDFLFEKYNDDVEEIGWEEFFTLFDREHMVMVYQTETEGGRESRFARIVRQDSVAQAVIE